MGFRDFTDTEGTRWSAWDVVPELVERRLGPRRTDAPAVPGFTATVNGRERRAGIDRRIMPGGRAYLSDGFQRGWLCFESSAEKRRLTPIPPDWVRCREAQLGAYCAQATRVRDSSRHSRHLYAVPAATPADRPRELDSARR